MSLIVIGTSRRLLKTVQVSYTLTKFTDGYLARCVINPVATAYGKTEEEAGENLVDAIKTYVKLYPEKADAVLKGPLTRELVLDEPK